MKAPDFWQHARFQNAIWAQGLSHLYSRITTWRANRTPRYTAHIPVICVGNVTMGGSGKTPVVHALTTLLVAHGYHPAILLRGYGGTEKGPAWVTGQPAAKIGDEALLHVAFAPTMVSADRARGAKLIEKNPSITHIVMDDGLQNSGLKKNISFLVIDGPNPFGNNQVFPLGPLRESPGDAVKRCDAVVIIGEDKFNLRLSYQFLLPVFHADVVPKMPKLFTGRGMMAFAGIGRPQKFFDTLEAIGVVLIEKIAFPDHHPYTEQDITTLAHKARTTNVPLVTTRKDWVRLPPSLQSEVEVLDIALQWQDEDAVVSFLKNAGVL